MKKKELLIYLTLWAGGIFVIAFFAGAIGYSPTGSKYFVFFGCLGVSIGGLANLAYGKKFRALLNSLEK